MASVRGVHRGGPRRDELSSDVFHVELRQFPHVARSFNLSGEELQSEFVATWVTGRSIEFDERRWSPEKTRLKIYEGPALRPEEIGMGRGWGNVEKHGEDVTDRLLAQAQQSLVPSASTDTVQALKEEAVRLAGAGDITIPHVLALASGHYQGSRVSDRLALAERAIWGAPSPGQDQDGARREALAEDRWGPVLLAWETWAPAPGTAAAATLELVR